MSREFEPNMDANKLSGFSQSNAVSSTLTTHTMDNIPQLGTAADLELRAARIADPGIGEYLPSVYDLY